MKQSTYPAGVPSTTATYSEGNSSQHNPQFKTLFMEHAHNLLGPANLFNWCQLNKETKLISFWIEEEEEKTQTNY